MKWKKEHLDVVQALLCKSEQTANQTKLLLDCQSLTQKQITSREKTAKINAHKSTPWKQSLKANWKVRSCRSAACRTSSLPHQEYVTGTPEINPNSFFFLVTSSFSFLNNYFISLEKYETCRVDHHCLLRRT